MWKKKKFRVMEKEIIFLGMETLSGNEIGADLKYETEGSEKY